MERHEVVSKTGMTGIGYDASTETLEISFRKQGQPDAVYQYAPFTVEQKDVFLSSESLGSHFLKVVKPRVGKDLTCTKIAPVATEASAT